MKSRVCYFLQLLIFSDFKNIFRSHSKSKLTKQDITQNFPILMTKSNEILLLQLIIDDPIYNKNKRISTTERECKGFVQKGGRALFQELLKHRNLHREYLFVK
jgi:hypothetical protein